MEKKDLHQLIFKRKININLNRHKKIQSMLKVIELNLVLYVRISLITAKS